MPASPVSVLLAALAEGRASAAGGVPGDVPVYAADWSQLGADSEVIDQRQIAYGHGFGDILAAAMAAEVRAGRITWGRVCDRRTGLVLAEYPAPGA